MRPLKERVQDSEVPMDIIIRWWISWWWVLALGIAFAAAVVLLA